ncbi:MAG TPA: hypothetical protein VIJ95_08110 [Hanamia sp.]
MEHNSCDSKVKRDRKFDVTIAQPSWCSLSFAIPHHPLGKSWKLSAAKGKTGYIEECLSK